MKKDELKRQRVAKITVQARELKVEVKRLEELKKERDFELFSTFLALLGEWEGSFEFTGTERYITRLKNEWCWGVRKGSGVRTLDADDIAYMGSAENLMKEILAQITNEIAVLSQTIEETHGKLRRISELQCVVDGGKG